MDPVAIRHIKEPLFQESGGTMRDHTVSFHFTESKSTVTCSAFRRLSCQNLGGTAPPRMDLVSHHVFQSLVIGRIEEDHDLHALASEAVVHDLVAVALVAQIVQLVRDVLHSLALEGRRVALVTVQTGHFG